MDVMKNGLRSLLLWMIFASAPGLAIAQTEGTEQGLTSAFKWNATDALVGRWALGFEQSVGANIALGLELDFIHRQRLMEFKGGPHPWYPSYDAMKRGLIVEPFMRWYPRVDVRGQGVYAAAGGFLGFARYQFVEPNTLGDPSWSAFGGALQVGYQRLIGCWVVDGYLGGTWANDHYSGAYIESTALFPPPSGWRVSAGLRLGVMRQR
jgi:hypothetical protein